MQQVILMQQTAGVYKGHRIRFQIVDKVNQIQKLTVGVAGDRNRLCKHFVAQFFDFVAELDRLMHHMFFENDADAVDVGLRTRA